MGNFSHGPAKDEWGYDERFEFRIGSFPLAGMELADFYKFSRLQPRFHASLVVEGKSGACLFELQLGIDEKEAPVCKMRLEVAPGDLACVFG